MVEGVVLLFVMRVHQIELGDQILRLFGASSQITWSLSFTRTVNATTAGAPLKLIDFENLFCFGGALHLGVIYFVFAALLQQYFLHLLFGYESSVVPESVFSQVFAAVVSDVVLIDALLLLFPVLDHPHFSVL